MRKSTLTAMILSGGVLMLAGYAATADSPLFGSAVPSADETETLNPPPGGALPAGSPQTLILREMPPVDPQDSGSFYTDAGLNRPASGPTERERVKLAMARAAVEASRAAGTLYNQPNLEDAAAMAPEDAEAQKLRRLRSAPVRVLGEDRSAGIGVEFAPVQKQGPDGLSAGELRKLSGQADETPASLPPDSPESPPIDPETGKEGN